MTRVLSELLGTDISRFGMAVRQLERAAGHPSADIRLTSEIIRAMKRKVSELGMDPNDTTPSELYAALGQKLERDEATVRQELNASETDSGRELLAAVQRYLSEHDLLPQVFAIKTSVARKLLKKIPPKKIMKQLRYRSLDSMLKHESVSQIYTAALFYESKSWHKKYFEQYSKLRPSDFEMRPIELKMPEAERWVNISQEIASKQKNHIVTLKEIGAIVVLPIEVMPGLAIASLTTILNASNEIRAASSYLKLHLVRPDFGKVVQHVAENEPITEAYIGSEPVPWKVIHQYYAAVKYAYSHALFEPHIQKSDLEWSYPDDVIASMHPSLEFWRHTRFLSYKSDTAFVSFNLLDATINYCNKIPYAARFMGAVRQYLWHELMLRYLNLENVEQAITNQLQPELVSENITVDDDM